MIPMNQALQDGVEHEYADEFHRQAEAAFVVYDADTDNLDALWEAVENYEKTAWPDGKNVAALLKGTYYRFKGLKESGEAAVRLLEEAYRWFEKAFDPADPELARIKLSLITSEIEKGSIRGNCIQVKLHLKKASLHRELGDMQNFHIDMSLAYMSAVSRGGMPRYPEEVAELANMMLNHAELSGNNDYLYSASRQTSFCPTLTGASLASDDEIVGRPLLRRTCAKLVPKT